MKNLLKYIHIVVVLFLVSCSDTLMTEEIGKDSNITINLFSSSLATKAVGVQGVDNLNENKIDNVHYFFFPVDPQNPDVIKEDVQPSHYGVIENVETTYTTSLKLKVSEPVFNKVIFPRPYDECNVYVIVNLPKDKIGTDKSLAALKSIALTANFKEHPQKLFVMEGMGVIKVNNRNVTEGAAEGTVQVKRIAAKITVNVNVVNKVLHQSVEWESQPAVMKMDFFGGISNAVVSANPEDVAQRDIFNLTALTFNELTETPQTGESPKSSVFQCRPFYSYPIKWNIGEENEPYFKITLPWTHKIVEDGATKWETKETYYKVILGGEILEHNTWTDITINLSAPGNFEDFPEYNVLILGASYNVVDWSSEEINWNEGLNVDTEILESRYLVVDNISYKLNNQSILKIPISTSHDCEIANIVITRPNYTNQNVGTSEITWDDEKWKLDVVKDPTEGSYVYFKHEMDNDIKSKSIDFAPYTVNFRVRHNDDTGKDLYFRDVQIVQNPAMMIYAEYNEGGNEVKDSGTSVSDDKGYVFVNGNQYIKDKPAAWDLVRSCMDGGNQNPNMYVISTTVPFDDYILTDPRKTDVTSHEDLGFPVNLDKKYWHTQKLITDSKGRTLEYYYETIGGEESHRIIAPKFRIASSYGKCQSNIDELPAKRRCAAYQERGYPAGRWRVPTPAEIRFIATLSNYGIIPKLFTKDNYYWTSDGLIKYGNDLSIQTSAKSGAVRCVYDDWYWEQTDTYKVSEKTFTWGDMER